MEYEGYGIELVALLVIARGNRCTDSDWPTGRVELFDAFGLPDAHVSDGFNSRLVDRGPAEMSPHEQHLVTETLEPICAELGYD